MASESSPSQPDGDFAALLDLVRQGDESAASELVQRYERAVLRCVRGRLGRDLRRAMDSMDVMQSVHRSLLIGLKNERYQLSSPQQLIGLAAVMVQRKIARHWRKIKHLPIAEIAASAADNTSACVDIASADPAPSEVVLADDLLAQFLLKLDDFDRQLVHLKLEGHSSVHTGEILGHDPAFIRMRWSRLRKLLRERGLGEQ